MQSGAEQLKDWMARRHMTATETAEYFGWDKTFVSKIVRGHRLPGLANAITIERMTGIPVEAWMPSEVDRSDDRADSFQAKAK